MSISYGIYKHLLGSGDVRVGIPASSMREPKPYGTSSIERIMRYKDMWDRGHTFRKKRARLMRYVFGDQWSDYVEVDGKLMTEEENILSQGKVPLKNNLMRALINSVLGTFRSNHTEPQAISRDRDEQKLGEMMTIAVQAAYQNNEAWELDARCLEEFAISGFAAQVVRYHWWRERQTYDAYIANVNPARCFFNADVSDTRGHDIRTFGVIEDLTLDEVIHCFARTRVEAIRLREIYKNCTLESLLQQYDVFTRDRIDNLDFLRPDNPSKCRVIQVWELVGEEVLRVHDQYKGEMFTCGLEQEENICRENARRLEDALSHGVAEEEVKNILIRYQWSHDQYWKVSYLSPFGDILFEGRTPYYHNGMPFEVAMQLVDGEIHSLAESMVDQQRYINRLITLADFIIGTSAKGVLVFPEDALGSMSKQEVLDEWTSYRGVIFARLKTGMAMQQQIATNSTNVGIYELLNMQMKLMEDTTGIHAAMRGEQAKSGTPSSLYQQETQNAQNNLVDMLCSFDAFRRRRDVKLMKVIQQYYDAPRYINIAGHGYSEEAKWYNPEKVRNAEMDIVMTESVSSPAYRAQLNQFLLQALQIGGIDFKTLLRTGAFPFADNLIQAMESGSQEQQMEAMQQAAGQANPQGVEALAQAIGANGGGDGGIDAGQMQQAIQAATQAVGAMQGGAGGQEQPAEVQEPVEEMQ